MSKIKEIDEIAQYQADVILETLKEQVEWSIADYDLSGDDYYNLKDYTVYQTVIKLLEQVDLVDVNYLTNKIRLSLDNIYVTNKNK